MIDYPIQWMVDTPIRIFNWINAGMTTQDRLLHENEKLRVHEILLQSRLQKLLMLEKENAQLRRLLQSTYQISGRVTVASILAVALDPAIQQLVLDKGYKNHVYANQPVLDGFGVLGQVVGVGERTSRVLLLTDKQFAVPVEDYRNGARAIAIGTGISGKLKLINLPDTNDIQVGDLFVTSGLGLHYPVGYPVGMVSSIMRDPNNSAKKITLLPMAHVNEVEQVLLVWPSQHALTKDVQHELNLMHAGPVEQTDDDATPKSAAVVDQTKTVDKVKLKKKDVVHSAASVTQSKQQVIS